MDMQEFERNRRKKKENNPVRNINVNSAVDKKQFINFTFINNDDPEKNFNDNIAEVAPIANYVEGTTVNETPPNSEPPIKNERTFINESSTITDRAFDKGTSTKIETPTKLKAPKNLNLDLNSIQRVRVSLDSLRIEQIVKQIIEQSGNAKEVVIGRKVFESNGVNKARFNQSREETKDRGIIDYEIRSGKFGPETWYWLK